MNEYNDVRFVPVQQGHNSPVILHIPDNRKSIVILYVILLERARHRVLDEHS